MYNREDVHLPLFTTGMKKPKFFIYTPEKNGKKIKEG